MKWFRRTVLFTVVNKGISGVFLKLFANLFLGFIESLWSNKTIGSFKDLHLLLHFIAVRLRKFVKTSPLKDGKCSAIHHFFTKCILSNILLDKRSVLPSLMSNHVKQSMISSLQY